MMKSEMVLEEYQWRGYRASLTYKGMRYSKPTELLTRTTIHPIVMMTEREKSPVKATSEGIRFNIRDLKEGVFYSVEYKGERYLVGKEGKKIVIYRLSK